MIFDSTTSLGRKTREYELTLDVLGLLVCACLVHIVYVIYIDPAAAAVEAEAARTGIVPVRLFVILVKDMEQEICFILTLWCIWLWIFRYRMIHNEKYLIETSTDEFQLATVVEYRDNVNFNELDFVEERIEVCRKQYGQSQLIDALDFAVHRLRLNRNYSEATALATNACDLHLEVLDSKLAFNKYILWAIPSIGFLGTVRGIGQALSRAGEAMQGDISGVAQSLGMAFNSTWCALFLSLILMFLSYILQGREDRLVANFKQFIAAQFIPALSGDTPAMFSAHAQDEDFSEREGSTSGSG